MRCDQSTDHRADLKGVRRQNRTQAFQCLVSVEARRRGNSLVGQRALFALICAGENRVALRTPATDRELLTFSYCICEEFDRLV